MSWQVDLKTIDGIAKSSHKALSLIPNLEVDVLTDLVQAIVDSTQVIPGFP
jgi:hypothetical protein